MFQLVYNFRFLWNFAVILAKKRLFFRFSTYLTWIQLSVQRLEFFIDKFFVFAVRFANNHDAVEETP